MQNAPDNKTSARHHRLIWPRAERAWKAVERALESGDDAAFTAAHEAYKAAVRADEKEHAVAGGKTVKM